MTNASTTNTAIYRGLDRAQLDAAYNDAAAVVDSSLWVKYSASSGW
jgi:hypothetical protein